MRSIQGVYRSPGCHSMPQVTKRLLLQIEHIQLLATGNLHCETPMLATSAEEVRWAAVPCLMRVAQRMDACVRMSSNCPVSAD